MLDLLQKMLIGALVSSIVIVITAVLYFWLIVMMVPLSYMFMIDASIFANWIIIGALILGFFWAVGYLIYRMYGLY